MNVEKITIDNPQPTKNHYFWNTQEKSLQIRPRTLNTAANITTPCMMLMSFGCAHPAMLHRLLNGCREISRIRCDCNLFDLYCVWRRDGKQ